MFDHAELVYTDAADHGVDDGAAAAAVDFDADADDADEHEQHLLF
jgi:hypothetical protein